MALLAVLAAAGSRGLSRDRLQALLWPEGRPENARHALDQLVHLIRRQFGDEVLLGPDPLRLNDAVMAADAVEFEAATAARRFDEAVAAYRGPFLDGFHLPDSSEFEEWIEAHRRRLAEAFRLALRELALQRQREGRHAEAVQVWHRLVAEDPFSTPAVTGLIESLVTAGDRPAALRYARSHETLLHEDLGMEPGPEFQGLVAGLRSLPDETPPATTPHTPDGLAAPPAATESPVSSRTRRWRYPLAAAAVLVLGIAEARLLTPRRPIAPAATSRILVVPFRVTAPDSSLNYLGEGIIDLLAVALSSSLEAPVVDPQAGMAAWRSVAAGSSADEGWRADRAARKVGARHVIVGEVARSGRARITISAVMRASADGRPVATSVLEGPLDSLGPLVDRMALEFQASQSANGPRLLASVPTQALRPYLNGQALFRAGQYSAADESYREALGADPTFLAAAVGLALSSYWTGSRREGVELALRRRQQLSPADQAVIDAIAGPRFPAPATEMETLTLWERASTLVPDQAAVWFALGDRLLRWGAPLGVPNWEARSRTALQRAAANDSLLAGPLEDLLLLDLLRGDRVALQRDGGRLAQLTLAPEDADLVRWEVALGLSDAAAMRRVRSAMQAMPPVILYHIAVRGQRLPGGLADAVRAAWLMDSASGSIGQRLGALRVRHFLAMNQGRPQEGLGIAREMASLDPVLRGLGDSWNTQEHAGLRTMVLDALEWGGDSSSAVSAARTLASFVRAHLTDQGDRVGLVERDLCAAAQWEARLGDASFAERGIVWLGSVAQSGQPEVVRWFAMKCGLLLEVELAGRRQDRKLDRVLSAADSLLRQGHPPFPELEHFWLRIAQLRAALGQVGLARRALTHVGPLDPLYLNTILALQARLAIAAGDTTAARAAMDRLAALIHDSPETLARAGR